MRRPLVVVFAFLLFRSGPVTAQPCPANSPLALSCGNGTCNKTLGETAVTCPADCLDDKRNVKPYYSLASTCPKTTIFWPSTVPEAIAAMRLSVAQGKHVRVVGTVHTASPAVCVEHGNVISTERLDAIEGLESYAGQNVVKVQAGAHVWDVLNFLHQHGKALGYNVPGMGDISVGGFLAVGGHGSNGDASATMGSLVVAIDKMDPEGNVTTYDASTAPPALWTALRADLGLLGMTVRARLRIRDQFHVRQRIFELTDAELFQPGRLNQLADGCQYLFATYLNSVGRLAVTCGTETSDPVTAEDARMTLFAPDLPDAVKELSVPAFQRAACSSEAARKGELALYNFRRTHPWLEWTDSQGRPRRGLEAVGFAHRMTEISFLDLDRPLFSNRDWEVAVPASEMDAALVYIKSQLEEHKLYNPAIGIVLRADRANVDTLMASSAAGGGVEAGERLFYIEFPNYWPYEFTPAQLAAYEAPYAEMVRHLIANHRARPHWGKNRADIFSDPSTLASSADRRAAFQPWIDQLDPYGVFANDFYRQAGFSWPLEGQDWVPEYFPNWEGKAVSIRNRQEGRCLQPGAKGTIEARACTGAETQQYFLFRDGIVADLDTGEIRDPRSLPEAGVEYSLRLADDFERCVEKSRAGGARLRDCTGEESATAVQLWQFVPQAAGAKLRSKAAGAAPCLKEKSGSAVVAGAPCSDALQSPADRKRKLWDVVTP